jgi:hypothetical protein
MVIVGPKGLVKEVLEIFSRRNELHQLNFFDNPSTGVPPIVKKKHSPLEI